MENHQFTPFLKLVAQDLLTRFGSDLSQILVIMPSRRARLFLDDYLSQLSATPVWTPQYTDLNNLYADVSPLQEADSLLLVSELYKIYIKHVYSNDKTPESFDEFYFFGEQLLADFNDVDKYLIDADQLFANLDSLDMLKDNFEHLDMAQWEVINRFFSDIKTNATPIKEAFYSVWRVLSQVYHDFRAHLRNQNLAYEGMLLRDALNRMEVSIESFTFKTYVFVGFNLLTTAEERLFKLLKGKALFYWDYDNYYLRNTKQEAGRFMRRNLELFGQALEINADNLLQHPKQITLVTAAGQNAQSGYIEPWLKTLNKPDFNEPDTAIVLCDEQQMLSVIHALPKQVGTVNITMGFDLMQTPVAGFITLLMEMQQRGFKDKTLRYTYLLPILRHAYTRLIFPNAFDVENHITTNHRYFITPAELENDPLFTPTDNTLQLADYLRNVLTRIGKASNDQNEHVGTDNLYQEALFRVYQVVNRLRDLMHNHGLELEIPTFIRLVKRLIHSISVPYHGEPARGLQLMGMLETRNMDFRNLMLLSVNEGMMPKIEQSASFIPQFIRHHFKMSGIEHQDAMYAYYFYRLLQRAENIVLVYNTSNQQTGKSEMSRFLLQLLTEYPWSENIRSITLKADIQPRTQNILKIEKTTELMEMLHERYNIQKGKEGRSLSPSALNSYIDCPVQFYFRYIANILPPKELSDELDNSILGNLFHKTAELIYRQIGHTSSCSKTNMSHFHPFEVTPSAIDLFLTNKTLIDTLLLQAFDEIYFHGPTPKESYNGEQLIYYNVTKKLIIRLLKLDKQYAPFMMEALEQSYYREVSLYPDFQVRIGGIVDRLDMKQGVLRILDYKTSTHTNNATSIDSLFVTHPKRSKHTFQAFVYASILHLKRTEIITPALLYITQASDIEGYSPSIKIGQNKILNFASIAHEFETHFTNKLKELFDTTTPFTQTPYTEICKYCDYKTICGTSTMK